MREKDVASSHDSEFDAIGEGLHRVIHGTAESGSPRMSMPNIKARMELERSFTAENVKRLDREGKWRNARGHHCSPPSGDDKVLEPLPARTEAEQAALLLRRERDSERRRLKSKSPSSNTNIKQIVHETYDRFFHSMNPPK